ncbi:BON domain-containing protein [Pelagicoccus sp. SDUM812003]|uniref:BON domain-containing protein n=1 Tax=Pelagicoccus sp. SDUM812003 TaxID=3041267 RepID=UPI00280E550E|nr:BON domain-containing protein [Pelagicoccus sp. SDUM812003]MDQ8205530.1 BON domain-containing protein [Pelagicoccus sp. SDUM812003]
MKHYRTEMLTLWLSIVMVTLGSSSLTLAASESQSDMTVDDPSITVAIEEEYLFDNAVPYNDIDITTIDGIVNLEGTVNSLVAKRRATLIAETVKGVRAVNNRIEVQTSDTLSADAMEDIVTTALLQDSATESYEIQVEADDEGSITLTGSVDSWQEKRLAEIVTSSVAGVTEVNNLISIDYKTERPDSEMQAEIERMLSWNILVDDSLIEVEVIDEDAKLSGVVGSLAEKRQATNLAWVAGIDSVDASGLTVERWARDEDLRAGKYTPKTDEEIQHALNDALLFDPRVISLTIEPEVNAGWVSLRGRVQTMRAKEAAESIARNTVGVTGVSNLLKVRYDSPVDKREIEQTAKDKFSRDPWLSAESIHPVARDGELRLTGVVSNLFEKARAETLAHSINGVNRVENRIEVFDTESVVVYDPYIWSDYPLPWSYYSPGETVTAKVHADTPDDRITAKEIAEELFWSPYVSLDDVTISVEDGVATLIGSVDSRKEKDAATENAIEGGASAVINELTVDS